MKNTIVTLFFSLLTLAAFSQTHSTEDNNDQGKQFEKFKIDLQSLLDEPVVNFSLKDTSENIIQLNKFRNKTVVLYFWNTNCNLCVRNLPYLKKLQSYFKNSSNIIFICICIDHVERIKKWKELLSKHELDDIELFLPENKDNSEENQFYADKITSFPTCLLVSKNGKILGKLPNLDNVIAVYATENGLEGKSTFTSVNEAFTKNESFIRWVDINHIYISNYMMVNQQPE